MPSAVISNIDSNLELIRATLNMLAVKIESLHAGGMGGAGKGETESGGRSDTRSDFTDVSQFSFNREEALSGLEDIEGKQLGDKSYTDILVEQTYALKTAAIAARGYLMLLDQMGLNKEQKHMIRELEYGMMAVMKMAQAVSLATGLMEAGTLNPKAIFTIGGYAAGSIAYSMKMQGGGV